MAKKELVFGEGIKIQKLNRIAIPKSLLKNLNLKIGNEIEIYLDKSETKIIVKKAKK